MKKRFLVSALCSTGVVCFASILIHPFGEMKASAPQQPLLSGARVDSSVIAILAKSCQNCHSQSTEWPWYSYVAPMSWLVEADVQGGRSHMNMSRWSEYTDEQKQHILSEMASRVRNRKMPLPKYLVLHPSAKLSDSEVEQLYLWARKERKRLKSIDAPAGVTSSGYGN